MPERTRAPKIEKEGIRESNQEQARVRERKTCIVRQGGTRSSIILALLLCTKDERGVPTWRERI